ncbi:hypothetical protein CPC08DRAFT_653987, partial [Agrocybe pediades]
MHRRPASPLCLFFHFSSRIIRPGMKKVAVLTLFASHCSIVHRIDHHHTRIPRMDCRYPENRPQAVAYCTNTRTDSLIPHEQSRYMNRFCSPPHTRTGDACIIHFLYIPLVIMTYHMT